MYWQTILATLQYLGIGPDKVVPALLVVIGISIAFKVKLDPINKTLRQVCAAIVELQTIARGEKKQIAQFVEAPGSPTSPTVYGAKLIKESGLEDILNNHQALLFSKLRSLLPSNPKEYDVQDAARQALIFLKEDPITNPVKDYAYKNGMDAGMILSIGGLWLRDDYLGVFRKTVATEKAEH
jgi:hypothetical protein